MKNDNRNDRRASGAVNGTGKTKVTGKINAVGTPKMMAGKEKQSISGILIVRTDMELQR